MIVQSDGSYSALSPVVHGDIARSANTNTHTHTYGNENSQWAYPDMSYKDVKVLSMILMILLF